MVAKLPSISILMADVSLPAREIAVRNGVTIHGQDFLNQVCRFLNRIRDLPEERWALFTEDAYLFSVALMALLHAEKTVILIPNIQQAFVSEIAEHLDGIVSDKELDQFDLPSVTIETEKESTRDQAVLNNLNPEETQLELFTSGTTGRPQGIHKRLVELEVEVESIEDNWGDQIGNAVAVSTVSHQHIYGLLYRILWPLCTGRPFVANTCQFPDQVLRHIESHSRSVLISSPAFLNRVSSFNIFGGLSEKIATVFSSGGPLNRKAAVALYQNLNFPVLEIFGSSETGGVGYRYQTTVDGPADWTPIPGVKVRTDPLNGTLAVCSPFTANEWLTMGDLVTIDNAGHFELRGRADKVVKIEEKRLSLSEMEEQLCRSDLVDESVAVVLDGTRQSVAMVVVLSAMGTQTLEHGGKREIARTLKTHLGAYFEAVVLPRKWRFVDSIPVNSQGKTTVETLQSIFEDSEDQPDEPIVQVLSQTSSSVDLELRIPEELVFFAGHFPDQPVLPGIVQIDWAVMLGRKYLRIPDDFKGMEVVKFHEFIQPNDALELHLEYKAEKTRLYFTYDSAKGKHSSGRIIFG